MNRIINQYLILINYNFFKIVSSDKCNKIRFVLYSFIYLHKFFYFIYFLLFSQIAGDANEDQILAAALVCMNNKEDLLQKILNDLYQVFRFENCKRMDQALCIVLEAMEKHPSEKHIQISGR